MSLSSPVPFDGLRMSDALRGWRVAVPAAFVALWAAFAALPAVDPSWRWPVIIGVALFIGAGAELVGRTFAPSQASGTLWLLPAGVAVAAGGWLAATPEAPAVAAGLFPVAVVGAMVLQTLEGQRPPGLAAAAHATNVVMSFILAYVAFLASAVLPPSARVGVTAVVGASVVLVTLRTLPPGRWAPGAMALATALIVGEAALVVKETPLSPPSSASVVLVALYGAVGSCVGLCVGAPPRRYAEPNGLSVVSMVLLRIAGW